MGKRMERPHYWYNDVTKEQTNTRPAAVGIEHPCEPELVFWRKEDGEPTWTRPAEFDWHEKVTKKDGVQVSTFHNPQLKETVDERPAHLAWMRVFHQDQFYYNTVTEKTQWERPAELGQLH